MIEEPEKTFKAVVFVRRNWDNPLTAAIIVAFVFLGGGFLAYNLDLFEASSQISLSEGILTIVLCLLFLLVWLITSRPRKTLPGKIGIVVAIAGETKKEEIRLRADFIDALWPAAGLIDTNLRSFGLPFELHRTEIPQC